MDTINALLKIYQDFIYERKSDFSNEIVDWKGLLNISFAQQTLAIVFYKAKEFIPIEFRATIEAHYIGALTYYVKRNKQVERIENIFSENKIDYFFVKGQVIASFYNHPEFRTMGDVDLIVKDREKAVKLLIAIGGKVKFTPPDKEWIIVFDDLVLELHDRLIFEEKINLQCHEKFLENPFLHVVDNKLDNTYHFIYTVIHLRKHLLNMGVGFRQFLDILFLAKNDTSIDFKYVREKFIELKLDGFMQVCSAFIKKWFDYEIPYPSKKISQEFYVDTTNQIVKNGVFGFFNKDNYYNDKINDMYAEKKRSSFIRKIFPSYSTFANSRRYSFVINRKYLLPIACIYRWIVAFLSIFNFRKFRKKHLDSIPEDVESKRKQYIKNWEL